jgi:hypothetical protein
VPDLRDLIKRTTKIVTDGWLVSLKTAGELIILSGVIPMYAYFKGMAYLGGLHIVNTSITFVSPAIGGLTRGTQLMLNNVEHAHEKNGVVTRGIVWTFVMGCAVTGILFPLSSPISKLFTNDTAILNVTIPLMHVSFPGELVAYPTRAIIELGLWTLYQLTGCAMGVSFASAALFVLVTLPMYLTNIVGFDFDIDFYVAILGGALAAMTGYYAYCVKNKEVVEEIYEENNEENNDEEAVFQSDKQGEKLRCCGIFNRRGKEGDKQKLLQPTIPEQVTGINADAGYESQAFN